MFTRQGQQETKKYFFDTVFYWRPFFAFDYFAITNILVIFARFFNDNHDRLYRDSTCEGEQPQGHKP